MRMRLPSSMQFIKKSPPPPPLEIMLKVFVKLEQYDSAGIFQVFTKHSLKYLLILKNHCLHFSKLSSY